MFGIRKFHKYLCGRGFKIITDHKPLIYLMSEKKSIPDVTSPRMLRWIVELSAYEYSMEHKSGKTHQNADTLSRLPLDDPELQRKCEANVFLMQQLDTTPMSAAEVKDWTSKDPVLAKVKSFILSGWPDQLEDSEFKPFVQRKHELSVEDGCILWGSRVIIPPQGRQKVLKELHQAHPGMSRMKGLARGYVWWPQMEKGIELKVKSCMECLEHQRAPEKAPIHPWEMPNKSWSRVHIDYAGPFEGKMILVVIDAYSKWTEAEIVSGSTSQITIERLRHIFASQGLPDIIVSDNATCFKSQEFQEFLRKNGIRHVTSAPFHPSTNSLAEKGVQIVKNGLKKIKGGSLQERMDKFLFNYRLTPQSVTEHPPCELLNKRRMRTRLDLIRPNVHAKLVRKQEDLVNDSIKVKVRTFKVSDDVIVRNYANGPKWIPGVICSVDGPLNYTVELYGGRLVRKHIDQIKERVLVNKEFVEDQSKMPEGVSFNTGVAEIQPQVTTDNVDGQMSGEEVVMVPEVVSAEERVGNEPKNVNVTTPEKVSVEVSRRVSNRKKQPPEYLQDYVVPK